MEKTVQTVTRLSPEVYREFEKKFPNSFVDKTTTEIEAGFRLGVQTVLAALRQALVTE